MFSNMFLEKGPILLLKVCERLKEPFSEKIFPVLVLRIEQISISKVNELPGIILIHELRKIFILHPFNFRNFTKVCRHMIELSGLVKDGDGILMHFPVKGRKLFGDKPYGLEPACSCRLQMKS